MLPSAPELRWAGGLVHSSLVGAQTATPTCSAVPRVMAGLHALNLVGQVTANSADAALFRDWAPGPYGEWSGDCKKLTSTAWYRATGALLVSGNAKPSFDYYWARRSQKGCVTRAPGAWWASTPTFPTATSRWRSAATESPRPGELMGIGSPTRSRPPARTRPTRAESSRSDSGCPAGALKRPGGAAVQRQGATRAPDTAVALAAREEEPTHQNTRSMRDAGPDQGHHRCAGGVPAR
jgi:hypothetical protein